MAISLLSARAASHPGTARATWLKQSQRHPGIKRPAIPGKEQRLVRIRRAIGHHVAGGRIFLVRNIVDLSKELREADPLVIVELEVLMDIQVGDDIGRDAYRVVVVQEVTIHIVDFHPTAPPAGGMIVGLLEIDGVRRHVRHRLAVPHECRRNPAGQELIAKIDVPGVDMRVGTGEPQPVQWTPVVEQLNAPILRRAVSYTHLTLPTSDLV